VRLGRSVTAQCRKI